MGRKSTKEDKNIYQISRESQNLTREEASEILETISIDRINRIETEKCIPYPDEVLKMAQKYKSPILCNYYCSHECRIGQEFVPEIQVKNLANITLEMLATLNALNKDKDRLIEITADGQLSEDEMADFNSIQDNLDKMSMTIDSLKLWVSNALIEQSDD